jgi:UDP-N-acetyl-D-mannosaminuronate dehydrogenase
MISTVSVIGLGYIGLPTALLLAKNGLKINGFDVSKEKIELLQKGQAPFTEHGLDKLFEDVKKKKSFNASTTLRSADAYIIAVPTPQQAGKAELKYVLKALASVKKSVW